MENMEPTIMPLTLRHVRRFVHFRKQSASETSYVNPLTEAQARQVISEWRTREKQGYVLLCAGDLVGQIFATFPLRSSVARINLISVLKDHGGKGYARILLEKVRAVAIERGYTAVELIVHQRNLHAVAWYERNGFIRSGTYGKTRYRYTLCLSFAQKKFD